MKTRQVMTQKCVFFIALINFLSMVKNRLLPKIQARFRQKVTTRMIAIGGESCMLSCFEQHLAPSFRRYE